MLLQQNHQSSIYHRFLDGDESFSCTCTTRPGVRLSASSTNSPHDTSRLDSKSSTYNACQFTSWHTPRRMQGHKCNRQQKMVHTTQ